MFTRETVRHKCFSGEGHLLCAVKITNKGNRAGEICRGGREKPTGHAKGAFPLVHFEQRLMKTSGNVFHATG